MQSSWIVVFITTVVMVSHGYEPNLQVGVVPKLSSFKAEQVVEVILTYKNTGSDKLSIYSWYVPSQELTHPLFHVTRDGKTVLYVGPLAKRSSGSAAKVIILKSGEEVSTVVPLSSAYDMTESGQYVVTFQADISSMFSVPSFKVETKSAPSADKIGESVLQSQPVSLDVEGHPNSILIESAKYAAEPRATTYTYYSCSESRKSSIVAAINVTKMYALNAVNYLNQLTPKVSTRYITWFGTYTLNNLGLVIRHFSNISTAYNTQSMSFDCSCSDFGVFAYVYPSQPYKIYLCPAFWTAVLMGTDSKGGTLVHEASHFTVLGGTQDNGYGQTTCKTLAKKYPAKAIMNGDSHEYFAENNPVLP